MRGFVPTPEWLVDHMVAFLFEGRSITAEDRLLDPGCGNGAFMQGVLRWAMANRQEPPHMTGIEVDQRLADDSASRFQQQPHVTVVQQDFLKCKPDEGFHYIIGNPPYVSILQMDEREKMEYRSVYRTATGRFDLYMLFFERAIDVLEPGGRLVFVNAGKVYLRGFGIFTSKSTWRV